MQTNDDPLERAIVWAGGLSALGRVFVPPVTPQAVCGWRKKGVPPIRAVAIERATDGLITLRQLCPKFFGEE
jgi:DNA-binding transcriptional regulator YdaS (Cro superfamily)